MPQSVLSVRHRIASWLVVLFAPMSAPLSADSPDLDKVLARLREPILEQRVNLPETEAWLQQIGGDGRWKDIDYMIVPEKQKSYAPDPHQKRCRAIALMLAKNQAKPAAVLPKLGGALAVNLGYKHEPRFTWANDWYATHIAVPGMFADTLLLLDGVMPRNELLRYSKHLRDGLSVPRQDGKPFQFKDAGQNLQWVARVSLVKAAIERDEELMRRAFNVVSSTISYQREGPEGIKVDAIFHQHGRQIYNGGYGLWYVSDMVGWFRLSQGTSFAKEFKFEQLEIFRHMLLGGHQWLSYRGVMDFGTRGRNISRPRNQGGVANWTLEGMAEFDKRNKARYDAWIAHNKGGPFPQPGNRHFWKSDIMVHRGAEYYCSVKMISKRTDGTETMNGENLLGHNLPLGATCIMTHGREYDEIWPVWDWSRVPGTTARLGAQEPSAHVFKGGNEFCGGASDGLSGVIAFSSDYKGVRSSKAAFGFGGAVVYLTSGITAVSNLPIATSINQCLLNGEVTLDGKALEGGMASAAFRSIHHDNIAYVMLDQNTKLEVRAGPQSGSWQRVSNSQSPAAVNRNVFSAWIDHGINPKEAGSAYLILPGVDAAACQRMAENHGFTVLRNDQEIQAVMHPEMNLIGAVFHKPGELELSVGVSIAAEKPAVVLIAGAMGRQRVFVGDPLCREKTIRIRISDRLHTADMGEGDLLGKCVEAFPGHGGKSP